MEIDSWRTHVGESRDRERRDPFFFHFRANEAATFTAGIFHRPNCDTRAELISASGCVRVRRLYDGNLRPTTPTYAEANRARLCPSDNFVVCEERLNRVRAESSNLMAKKQPRPRGRGGREGEGEGEKKEPRSPLSAKIRPEDCHPQNSLEKERDDRTARFAGYIILFCRGAF